MNAFCLHLLERLWRTISTRTFFSLAGPTLISANTGNSTKLVRLEVEVEWARNGSVEAKEGEEEEAAAADSVELVHEVEAEGHRPQCANMEKDTTSLQRGI